MNYTRIYNNIIKNRLANPYNGYVEKHHIIPKSLGGSDKPENLISLTAREHFICHLLLTKIYTPDTVSGKKMIRAFVMMLYCRSNNQDRYITSREFSILREQFSILQKQTQGGENNSQYGSRWKWIHNDITREIRKIKFDIDIPIGWEIGLTFDVDKISSLKHQLIEEKRLYKQSKIAYLTNWCNIYKTVGFDEFVKITGYNKSKQNLVQMFSRYVEDFVPQNGKKR